MRTWATIAVDVGNSAIKLGWQDDASKDSPIREARIPLFRGNEHRPDDDWLADFSAAVRQLDGPRRWFVASVNEAASQTLVRWIASHDPQDICQLLTWQDLDFQLLVRFPHRVGIDRLLGAWSAVQRTGVQDLITVDVGSAVTLDLVRGGKFCGGAILPGPRLQFHSLAMGTSQLPEVPWGAAESLEIPGRDTHAAIRSGVLLGLAGAIDRILDVYQADASTPLPVILTGGDALVLAGHMKHPFDVQRDAILWGILHIAGRRRIE